MKGTTHFIIGAAIGAAASLLHPFDLQHASIYVAVAGFSALSADLDGPSLLVSKVSKLSRWLRSSALWIGVLLVAVVGYLYLAQARFYPVFTAIAVMLFLLGLVAKEGVIRNALLSLIGAAIIYAGWRYGQNWLMGFGLFVGWVPWLKHRGMTHTVWAIPLWGLIGSGLENQLQIDGIAAVSVAGYTSHLLADTLTPSGVKWFYPLYKKSIKL